MIRPWRHLVQVISLLLLVAIPLLTFLQISTAVQGWFQAMSVAGVVFVSPLEGAESIIASGSLYGSLLIGLIPSILIAVLLGRVFCSWCCPLNLFQEISDGLGRVFRAGPRGPGRLVLPKGTIFVALAADLVIVVILGAPFFAIWSPPGLVGREIMMAVFYRTLALEGAVIVLVLLLNLLTPRLFCRYLCPLGGMLAALGAKRPVKIRWNRHTCTDCGTCDPTCPMGLTPSRGESETVYCWNCATCRDACPEGSLKFGLHARGRLHPLADAPTHPS